LSRSVLPLLLRDLIQGQRNLHASPERTWAEVRARQIQAIARLTPLSMGANLVNAALVLGVVWPVAEPRAALAWFAVMVLLCATALWTWQRGRGRRATQASPRSVRRLALHAGVLAAMWSVPPVFWFPGSPPAVQLTLASVACGMLCAGVFLLSGLPAAGLTYTVILLAACFTALALQGDPALAPTAALLGVYGVVLGAGMLSASRISVARLLSEREAARQSQVVGLLLQDFEEHAADVLWQTDRHGRLTHVSPRLMAMLSAGGRAVPDEQTSLLDALAWRSDPTAAARSVDLLRRAFVEDKPFRDLLLPMGSQGAEGRPLWWSITAKPLVDEHGRTQGWRGVIADVSAQKNAQDRMEDLAQNDDLTRLANRPRLRKHLEELLQQLASRPPEPGQPRHALLCLDVDHFKGINDAMGHQVGDAVLKVVARRLEAMMQPGDLVARLGGDEFAVVLGPDRGGMSLEAWCDRLIGMLGSPAIVSGRTVPLAASMGVALLPDDGASIDEALGNADHALYAAKGAGRATWRRFDASLGERSRREAAIEQALREALSRQQLHLHWQPLVDIGLWEIRAAEALLRWQHPELGNVSPGEFIPVAERTGLIIDIGTWVLRHACEQARRHLDGLSISVNVSPLQLMRPGFVDVVERALADSGLAPQRLQIEITESVMIENAAGVRAVLTSVKDLGVGVALDDFGTGYSSLAYLRSFRFDTLKIDRAFVREMVNNSEARAIVRTIVQMATTLGMKSVAEGVEDQAQFEYLRRAGCTAIQGFLVTRPLPLDDFHYLMRHWVDGSAPDVGHLPDTLPALLQSA
jgi:diguanylate cyclase (GGDEF)-like protein